MSGCPRGIWPDFVAELVDEALDLGPILASYTEKRGFRRMTGG